MKKVLMIFALCSFSGINAMRAVIKSDPFLQRSIAQRRMGLQAHKIFVRTSDGEIVSIDRWKIDQMKVLLVLLEHQHGVNSQSKPLEGSMISSQELHLLLDALNAASIGEFKSFFFDLAQKDGIDQEMIQHNLGNGALRMLVNAAQKVEAQGLSALCSSYFLPSDMQKLLISTFIDFSVSCLKSEIIKKYAQERKIDLLGCPNGVDSVLFSSDGSRIVSSNSWRSQNNLILWNGNTGKKVATLVGHSNNVTAVSFSPDGSMVVSGSRGDQNNLILWNGNTGKKVANLVGHSNDVTAVSFSPDGSRIVSGSRGDQNNLILWNGETGEKIANLVGNLFGVTSISFSPDGSRIVSGSDGNQNNLILWNGETGAKIANLVGNLLGVTSVSFSPDGSRIVSGSNGFQNNLILWNGETGAKIANLVGNLLGVTSVSFSPDGSRIVSRSFDNLMLWNGKTGEKIANLVGNPFNVLSMAFSPDGSMIVSGSEGNQNNLILWNGKTGEKIINLVGHNLGVMSVVFSSDGNRIVSGSSDDQNNLMLWKLFIDQEIEALKNLNKCTVSQARLLYQLCLALSQDFSVQLTAIDYDIFNSLPELVRNVLQYTVKTPVKR